MRSAASSGLSHARLVVAVGIVVARGIGIARRVVAAVAVAGHGNLSRTASQAVGYREVLEHLSGKFDLPTTIERVKHATHQFARRQETWFRGLQECRFMWLPYNTFGEDIKMLKDSGLIWIMTSSAQRNLIFSCQRYSTCRSHR